MTGNTNKGEITMSNKLLSTILSIHFIEHKVIDNRVIAENEYTIDGVLHTETVDMTGISIDDLYDWLGY